MNNLQKLREEKGLTQQKLCDKLEKMDCIMCRSAYSRYENGNRNMPSDVLIKLADFYGISVDDILRVK